MKKKAKLRLRLALLHTGSFLASAAPLVICFIINFDEYVQKPDDAVKLCAGGMISLVLIFLATVGKLKMPRRITAIAVMLTIAYLMRNILSDLILLLAMALIGELVNCICFSHAIKSTRENILVEKTADATASQVEEVLKKYIGNGRV